MKLLTSIPRHKSRYFPFEIACNTMENNFKEKVEVGNYENELGSKQYIQGTQ